MGLTKAEAASLANQILKTPDKTAKLKGNLEDLEAKLKAAKGKLASVPDSRKAKVRAEISDLEAKIRAVRPSDIGDHAGVDPALIARLRGKELGELVKSA